LQNIEDFCFMAVDMERRPVSRRDLLLQEGVRPAGLFAPDLERALVAQHADHFSLSGSANDRDRRLGLGEKFVHRVFLISRRERPRRSRVLKAVPFERTRDGCHTLTSVVAGLDPAIHLLRKARLAKRLGPRVKPAGDATEALIRPTNASALRDAPHHSGLKFI